MSNQANEERIPKSDFERTPASMKSESPVAIVTPGSGSEGDESPTLTFVEEPHDNDVLCGRGGSINSHPGNERFRQLVEKRKRVYLTARFKREKRLIANSILTEIRSIDPPGRFLSRDPSTGRWYDIGDEKARDKTSQALRENAPSIRAEIEVEINQQRAEMQRVEDEEAAMSVPPPGPPHPYYQQPWGYYAPYHGYGQYHAEPPPHYGHGEHYERQWRNHYTDENCASPQSRSPRPEVHSTASGPSVHSHFGDARDHGIHSAPDDRHSSGFDVPSFVTSVPSSIAAWTRTSFSFGGQSDHPGQVIPEHHSPPKPIPYVHDSQAHNSGDLRQVRRMVHFEDDASPPSNNRPHPGQYGPRRYHNQQGQEFYGYGSPSPVRRDRQTRKSSTYQSETITSNSAAPKKIRTDHKADAQATNASDQEREHQSSLLSQVANHILGSWDTNLGCTNNSADETMMMASVDGRAGPPNSKSQIPPPVSLADAMEDEGGQEIELVDMMDFDDAEDMGSMDDDIRDDEHRMPPPKNDSMPPPPRRIEIDWPSKMLGCQSNWLPETFNPPTFFGKTNPLSPSASLDMDTSAVGTEGISMNGSIGGASLCKVFSHEQLDVGVQAESPMNEDHGLSQMPSWERSVRSKSPSTVCSEGSIVATSSLALDEFGLIQ